MQKIKNNEKFAKNSPKIKKNHQKFEKISKNLAF